MFKTIQFKFLFLFFLLLAISLVSPAQENNKEKETTGFMTSVSVTNNGISLIPTFTLGKPALLIDMSMGKRLTFDPQFKFSLEGKPWAFIFWWRYKLINSGKFRMNIGTHPAVLFSNPTATIDGITNEILLARRYIVGELSPNYSINEKINVGVYYLFSHGLQTEGPQYANFLTARASFTNLRLSENFALHIYPQFYLLTMDEDHGFYFTSTIKLTNKKTPFSISSVVNQTIDSEIIAGKDFVWNVSLTYTFNKKYKMQN